jgi:hypothetical protein
VHPILSLPFGELKAMSTVYRRMIFGLGRIALFRVRKNEFEQRVAKIPLEAQISVEPCFSELRKEKLK